MTNQHSIHNTVIGFVMFTTLLGGAQARVIEVTADRNSRYKIAGEQTPQITVQAGEQILLRVTVRKAKS